MSEEDSGSRERIRVRAYYRWLSGGCLSGRDEEYWYDAELREKTIDTQTGVGFSAKGNTTPSSPAQILGDNDDDAVEPDTFVEELEIGQMAKKKKGWLSSMKSSFGGAKRFEAETVKAPGLAESAVTPIATTTAKSVGVAEPENHAPASAFATASKPERVFEAGRAATHPLGEFATPNSTEPQADLPSPPPKTMSPRARLRVELASNASFIHDFQSDSAPPYRLGKGIAAAITTDEDGVEYLRLSDGAENADSGGATEGYSLRLPDEVERAASGNRVVVRVIARAAGGGQSRFALAYSTNDVGNSGWRWFSVGEAWSAFAFEYAVNPMIKGNGDFVGVLAEATGKPGVDVGCISVEVAPRAATP